MANDNIKYTVPGMSSADAGSIADLLQDRLHAYNDLHLTLKHIHWNVVGPNFIAVHEMLDPQVEAVRGFADAVAERIATLGGSPQGTPGALVAQRSWQEYSLGRAPAIEHLGALDLVYAGVISSNRSAIEKVGELDPITEDLLITQSGQLEQNALVRPGAPGKRARTTGHQVRAARNKRRQQPAADPQPPVHDKLSPSRLRYERPRALPGAPGETFPRRGTPSAAGRLAVPAGGWRPPHLAGSMGW